LTQFGYLHVNTLNKKERHDALQKAISRYGSLSVWKKLNVISIFTKHTNPSLHLIYEIDKKWIRSTFGIKAKYS